MMKSKILIYANLIQKLAIYKSGDNTGTPICCAIVMLDWVISPYKFTRDIGVIVKDKDYELSPNDYYKKYPYR